ncbi:MAG: M23 family metallopeptidase [Hydrogenovibrio sp.]
MYAVAAGKVVYAGNGIRQYGNMVVIKHDTEHLTVYAHNDSLQVKEGQRVKKGQLIATLGQTGSVKKPELYVEARYRGRKIDIKKLF